MKDNLKLELYTRPMCSDCQQAKEYLESQNVSYKHIDVEADKTIEEKIESISGSRVVPLFSFYKKGLFGKKKRVKNVIGFERNEDEIKKMLE